MDKILINKKSIKKNKDAGSQVSNIFTGSEITFEYESSFDDFDKKLGEGLYITSSEFISGMKFKISGYADHERFLKLPKNSKINIKNNYTSIYHLPIPEYSYDYKNTKV